MKKLLNFRIINLVIFAILFYSCIAEDSVSPMEYHLKSSSSYESSAEEIGWEYKLEYIQNNKIDILESSGIKLVDYYVNGKVKSLNDIEIVKSNILDDKSFIPLFDKSMEKVKPISIEDAKKMETSAQRYTEDRLISFLDSTVSIGVDIVKILWNYNGSEFYSTCIVSDEQGLIYDNIITNIFILSASQSNVPHSHKRLKSASVETQNGPISFSRTKGGTAYWLWGSERGFAEVYYSVSGMAVNGVKSIDSYYQYANDYMSIGKSDSKVTVLSAQTGTNGHYNVTWGWYIATPAFSIELVFTGSSWTVEIGTSLGTEAHGSGSEYVSPNQLN
ncbi:hypothetical protein [Echinicola salinicaeni]|uniref:hypothetical protein n=1 Tax=Echinicola salinicaeni TaxID=2762757 RepID=UPI001645E370|nr:hypothetical protein [Echinicola salinicaeni]